MRINLCIYCMYHRDHSKMTSPGKGGREVNKNGDFHCFRLQILLFSRWQGREWGLEMVIFAVTSFLNGHIRQWTHPSNLTRQRYAFWLSKKSLKKAPLIIFQNLRPFFSRTKFLHPPICFEKSLHPLFFREKTFAPLSMIQARVPINFDSSLKVLHTINHSKILHSGTFW